MLHARVAPLLPLLAALSLASCAPDPLSLPTTDGAAEASADARADGADASDATTTPDAPSADVRPPVCTPGAQVACACVGGAAGAQVCAGDGASLGPCMCPDGGADGGVDSGTDGGPDAADAAPPTDTPTDTPQDTASDTATPSDVPADVLVDAPSDVALDARADVPTDTPPDRPCSSSLATDPLNCGTCGNVCLVWLNSVATCASGTCGLTCNAGFSNCDGLVTTGCEVQTGRDPLNCGACGNVCTPPAGRVHVVATCGSGGCGFGTCAMGYADCDGATVNGCEADLHAPATCGVCGNHCAFPHAIAACELGAAGPGTAGMCGISSCEAGYHNCDGNPTNGCESTAPCG